MQASLKDGSLGSRKRMAPNAHAAAHAGSPPQRSHFTGAPPGLSHLIAPNGQASMQVPHPTQACRSSTHAPVSRSRENAPDGHAAAQGASSHWRQKETELRPPKMSSPIRTADAFRSWERARWSEQAASQQRQPVHGTGFTASLRVNSPPVPKPPGRRRPYGLVAVDACPHDNTRRAPSYVPAAPDAATTPHCRGVIISPAIPEVEPCRLRAFSLIRSPGRF